MTYIYDTFYVTYQPLRIFQIYDKDYKCRTPLYGDIIEVSAEAIEVKIECLRELRLGEVKGRYEHIIPYAMLSKGKYNLEYV